jgi:hypothetical protein
LLEKSESLYLSLVKEENSVSFRAAMRQGGRSVHVERESLEALLLALGVEHSSKRCSYCGKVKPLDSFGIRADGQGRTRRYSRCVPCERARLQKYYPRANRACTRRRQQPAPEATP